jgi:hypothetical protein
MSIQQTFTAIWNDNAWIPSGGGASRSGCGSTMAYTENIRRELPKLIERFHIESMFDAPCGDFNWMRSVTFPAGFRYSGGDIVAPLISELNRCYPETDFRLFDMTRDQYPDHDLLFCRDCLIHLSYADIARALRGFLASRIRFILTTSYSDPINTDIPTGGYRPVNLLEPPFEFGSPMLSIDDWIAHWPQRYMFLWRREDLQQSAVAFIDRYFPASGSAD